MATYFKVSTNKSPITYAVGEEIIFTVTVHSHKEGFAECKKIKWELLQDDGNNSSGEEFVIKGKESFSLKTSLSRPGFVQLLLTALNPDNTVNNNIDIVRAGAGADIEKIGYHGNIPDDFDEYWGKIEKMIDDFTPEIVMKVPYTKDVPDWCDCYDIKISTPVGCVASGYLSIPKKEGEYPLSMIFLGYSVAGAIPHFSKKDINLCVNALGIENGFSREALAEKYPELQGYGFNKKENERPETTFWQNMMIRNLCATKWAKTLKKWDKTNIISVGGSQGALQATTLAAHDKDVTYLNIHIPWFCDLNAENNGYLKGWRPEAQAGLEYFDTVMQGARVKCPVNLFACLGDQVCQPASIMSLYNSITAPKKLRFLQSGNHGYRPLEWEEYYLYPDFEVSGRYKHYKGNEYEILFVAKDSETLEDTVVYKGDDGKIWTRPKHMWADYVVYENKMIKRFEKV